jgi:hypothetical protein
MLRMAASAHSMTTAGTPVVTADMAEAHGKVVGLIANPTTYKSLAFTENSSKRLHR